jgi:RNA polymerase sigma factor (sigma-70 family)
MQPLLSDSDRQRLVIDHLHCVHSAVRAFFFHSSAICEDELISDGYQALVLASRRFDPSRNVSFSTFAYQAIRGAMTDALNADRRNLRLRTPLSNFDAECSQEAEHVMDLDRGRLTAQVLSAVDTLPFPQRILIKGHFVEERKLAEVAAQLRISKARAARLLAQAIQTIRRRLDDSFSDWPVRSKRANRRFSCAFKAEVVRQARRGTSSISQLARDLNVPASNIRTWLKRASHAETQLAAA